MTELVVRIIFSLLVVLGLMWLLAKLTRRRGVGRGPGGLTLLSRQSLSRNASVAVIRVGDRALVIGITDTQVSLIAETDLADLESADDRPERRDPVPLDHDRPIEPVQITAGARTGVGAMNGAGTNGAGGRFAGSVLSPQTWRSFGDFLRERTARS